MPKKKEYDDDPVYYCKRCLSLKVFPISQEDNQDYCADCGSANIGTASIEEWKVLYEKMYGHPYIKKRVLKWPYWC